MAKKKADYRLPSSVEEAAEMLISDLLMQHLQALSNLSESDFNQLCEKVAPYLIDEFQIWQGNDELLDSCFTDAVDTRHSASEPARIILNRVKDMLKDFHGILLIT